MFSPSTSGFSLGTLAPPPPKNMHVRLTGDSKLRSKCEPEWLFSLVLICVDLWRTGYLSSVYPASHPMTAGIGFSPPATLSWLSGYRKWMDGKRSSSKSFLIYWFELWDCGSGIPWIFRSSVLSWRDLHFLLPTDNVFCLILFNLICTEFTQIFVCTFCVSYHLLLQLANYSSIFIWLFVIPHIMSYDSRN